MWYLGQLFALWPVAGVRSLGFIIEASHIFCYNYPKGTVKAFLTFHLFQIYFSTLSVTEIKMAGRIFHKAVHITKKQSDQKKMFDVQC